MPTKMLVGVTLLLGVTGNVVAETIIHAGRLINGHDGAVHETMSLVIADGRINAVRSGYIKATADDTLIDLQKFTVMPG